MVLAYVPKKKFLLAFGDVVLISAAYFLAQYVRFHSFEAGPWEAIAIVLGCFLATFYLCDLYEIDIKVFSARYLFRFLVGLIFACGVSMITFYWIPPAKAGRGIFILTFIFLGSWTYAWRIVFEILFRSALFKQRKLLIVGDCAGIEALRQVVSEAPDFQIAGVLNFAAKDQEPQSSLPLIRDIAELSMQIDSHSASAIVTANPHQRSPELSRLLLKAKMSGIEVYDIAGFFGRIRGKVPVEHIDDAWLVGNAILGVRRTIYNNKAKRILDTLLSFFGLILSSPISLLTMIAIKLDSRGPIFYRQTRVGVNGEVFEVVKFRSMRTDAEVNGAVWADESDDRVTRVGRIIRKLRIDEIPQMWNVLKGEMSFIGPRPERPEFTQDLETKIPYYSLRHAIKPGITGWAQVNYSYGATEKDAMEKLQYDLFYIKNLSPLLDFHVLLKTVKVVLWGRGAR